MDVGSEKAKELSESVESLDKDFLERVAKHQTNRRLSVPRVGTDLTFTHQQNLSGKGGYVDRENASDDSDAEEGGAVGGAEGVSVQESRIRIEDCSGPDNCEQLGPMGLNRAALERLYQEGVTRQSHGDGDDDSEEEDINRTRQETEQLLKIMETEKDKRQRRGSWKSVWDEDDPEEDSKINEDVESDPMKRLLWAAENNEMETAKDLLDSKSATIDVQDEDGYSPLHRAAYNGHTVMVEFLLERGAELCARTKDGWQPLHCAARWNNPEVASLLLQAGCDVNAATNGGQTALHLAASNAEAEEIINMLLMSRYIDVSVKNGANETAYDLARRTGRLSYMFEIRDKHMLPSKS